MCKVFYDVFFYLRKSGRYSSSRVFAESIYKFCILEVLKHYIKFENKKHSEHNYQTCNKFNLVLTINDTNKTIGQHGFHRYTGWSPLSSSPS